VVQVGPGAATLGPDGAALGIYPHAPHPPQVQNEATIAGPEARDAVTAAAHGQEQIVLTGEPHRRDHIGHPGGADDERGAPVVHGVVDLAGFAVVLVAGPDQLSP
jgi:hypothetical protein